MADSTTVAAGIARTTTDLISSQEYSRRNGESPNIHAKSTTNTDGHREPDNRERSGPITADHQVAQRHSLHRYNRAILAPLRERSGEGGDYLFAGKDDGEEYSIQATTIAPLVRSELHRETWGIFL